MAVPSVVQNGSFEADRVIHKAKPLVVRSSSNDLVDVGQRAVLGKSSELAEHLNEETKQKYVKGRSTMGTFLFGLTGTDLSDR